MGALETLLGFSGKWSGTYRLWFEPDRGPRESKSLAWVSSVAQGRFARIDYKWDFEGKPQDGSILFERDRERGMVTALWADSWHMSDKLMMSEGHAGDGGIDVRGSYAAPPGPDWGWRTVVGAGVDGALRMVMYNGSPDGREDLAVEAVYTRAE